MARLTNRSEKSMMATTEHDDEAATLRRLEEQLLDARVRASADQVAALIAHDFVEFGSSGVVYDKAEVVAALPEEHLKEPPVERTAHDFRVRMLAEGVALVTYRSVRCHPNGAEVQSLRSSIWTVIDGRWQMVFHQGTPIPSRNS
jgi:hypothetical protein